MTRSDPRPIACFGETLLRFSPPGPGLLSQHASMTVHAGGAEANVAVSLACMGAPSAVVTVLPDNALGHAARDEVRRHGVDVSRIALRPGRMGLYFLTPGAVRRPSEVLYDRAGSAFCEHVDQAIDWTEALSGAGWLHLSGVTPATGPGGSAAALKAVATARDLNLPVSFDGNYRARLWSAWDSNPPAVLKELMSGATLAFADDRDFALILGRKFDQADPDARLAAAAEAAFEAFPRLERIVCTRRSQDSVSDQDLAATMTTRSAVHRAPSIGLSNVVDRVGGGDAFASGVLYGLWSGLPEPETLAFGLAAAGLKHSIPGDFNLFNADQVRAAMQAEGFDIRR